MGTVYEAAREYAAKGYSVIPIQPGKKVPAIKWAKFQEAHPSQLDLQSYFAGQDRNIAIVTGPVSGLVVVDIDNPDLFQQYQDRWYTGMVAQTPSGGYHLYYKYNNGDVGNPIGKLQAEIDVRGRGGYVLASPSTVDGKPYQWISQEPASPLPIGLHDKIIEILNYDKYSHEGATLSNDAEDGHILWVRVMTQGFTPHRHNQEVKDIARYLFRQGMNESVIFNTISALNSQDKTPLTHYELEATIRSGLKYEKARVASKPTAVSKSDSITPKALMKGVDNKIAVTDLAGLNEVVSTWGDVDWLVDGWLPEASIVMVASMPENYKTWLSFEAAVVVAYGGRAKPFLGEFAGPETPQPVLVVQQEDEIRSTSERFDYIIHGLVPDVVAHTYGKKDEWGVEWYVSYYTNTDAPLYFHLDRNLSLEDDESLDALEEQIKTLGIKLVVVDPFYSLATADDFFAGAARKIQRFKEMRDKYRVSFLLVHHTNKSAGLGGRKGIFGSNLLNGAMEAVWLVEQDEATKERTITRSGKWFPGKMPVLGFSVDPEKEEATGKLDYNSEVFTPKKGTDQHLSGLMLEIVQAVQSDDKAQWDNKMFYKYFKAEDDPKQQGNIRAYLKRLVDRELLVKEGSYYTAVDEA